MSRLFFLLMVFGTALAATVAVMARAGSPPVIWCQVPDDHDRAQLGGNAYIFEDGTADIWVRYFRKGWDLKEVKITFSRVDHKPGRYFATENAKHYFVLDQLRALAGLTPHRVKLSIAAPDLRRLGIKNGGPVALLLDCDGEI